MPMSTAIQEYKPIAVVSLRDGRKMLVPAEAADAIGDAVNSGKSPLVKIGDEWVDRFQVSGISRDYSADDAWGWLPFCPKEYRSRLRDVIVNNEERSGKKMTAHSAQCLAEQWAREAAGK